MNKKINFNHINCVDLTHTLASHIPFWSGECGFKHTINTDYADCQTETKFRVQDIEMAAGIGTHMDAPAHCFPNGMDIANLPLEKLFVPCVVIDVSEKSHEQYRITPQDILDFENTHGTIHQNSLVIMRTGWEKYWDDAKKYRNNLLFPTISEQATGLLLERDIAGLGIDTLSPDSPTDGFPVHRLVLGAGKYLIENVANLKQMPPVGAYAMALPLKIQGGTESPIRLVGLFT